MEYKKLKSRIAYRFDNIMARGVVSLVGLLGLANLLFIALMAGLVTLLKLYPPTGPLDFFEVYWAALLRTLDPGTMGQDDGFGFRVAMLVVTLSGVILVASLIGVISTAFNGRVEKLRKGRSRVIENEHTLILGWSSKVIPIIHEICIANMSRKSPAIVILADRDKVEMEDEIHAQLRSHGKTRIIVRSGDPMSIVDLEIVNPNAARSIIILASDDDEHADSVSIKTCLALVNSKSRKTEPFQITGEIRDQENLEAAQLVGGEEAHWVLGNDLCSRLIAQTCRQSGLSSVFTELLDFEGSEFYTTTQPSLTGKTYGVALQSFTSGVLVGLIVNGKVHLNPLPDTKIAASDLLIVVAEDDSSISVGNQGGADELAMAPVTRPLHKSEKTLVLGSNSSLAGILREMDVYMPQGSSVTVVSSEVGVIQKKFTSMKVNFVEKDPTRKETIEGLRVAQFDHIIVLSNREGFGVQQSDARTLLTLLHLRKIAKREGAKLNIVSEMLDDRNRELAQTTDADDFIVSDNLVSLMLAQLAENQALRGIFDAVLTSEGSEIRLHPAEWYVKLNVPVDLNTVICSAIRHQESALGYSICKDQATDSRLYGVVLNPDRSEKVVFQQGDKIVVLTND